MKKFILIFILVLIVVISFVIYWNYFNTYSEGNRSGRLQKFSKKGNIFKTHEGELIMSSISSTANVTIASEKFFFSVSNDSIARLMFDMEGKDVTVSYKEKRKALPWNGETTYIVDGVHLASE